MSVTVLAWNAHANALSQAGRVVRALSTWVGADVQVIVLTEVKGARKALKKWARENGFKLYQEPSRHDRADERGDTAVLLRVKGKHSLKPKRDWLAIMAEPWMVFRYHVLHRPRRHRRVVFLLPDGARVRLSGEHWPTRGNAQAWEESYLNARDFLERRGVALVVGDLNAEKNDVANLADDVMGRFAGRQPDWCVTNRPDSRVDKTELNGGGSDHVPLLFEITC